MSDRIPPSLVLCGAEVVNPARTLTYMKANNPAGRYHDIDPSSLPSILYRLLGSPETFTNPVSDEAPWYDPARPESGQFLGVLLDTATGLDGHSTRSVTQAPDGSFLGKPYISGVVIDFNGWILATTYAGLEYGKRWLIDALTKACNDCKLCDMQIRLCAPPDDASNDELCHWTVPNAALTKGPVWGNLTCPDIDSVKFTMTAESAWLYQQPVTCLAATPLWADNVPGGACVDFCDWMAGIGGPQQSCTITPPRVGKVATIVTIDATGGSVGNIRVGAYAACPPAPDDTSDTEFTIKQLPEGSVLIVDSSRHLVTYIAPDGSVTDGTVFIDPPQDGLPVWFEFDDCLSTVCVAAQVEHQCGGGALATVQIDVQVKAQ